MINKNIDFNLLSQQYQNNSPFPHIVIDNFIDKDVVDIIHADFPDLSGEKSIKINHENAKVKFASSDDSLFTDTQKLLFYYLMSSSFLENLQALTGIKETLLNDPYFFGGGFHEIKKGGYLNIHADFNTHKTTRLNRRLNLLIYLNKNWRDDYNGELELWDKNMKNVVKKIKPIFNRAVIFSTNSDSFHGHPDKLNIPENESRKSIALYYYSNGRPEEEIVFGKEDHGTIYKYRKKDKKDFKTIIRRNLKDLTPPLIYRMFKNKK